MTWEKLPIVIHCTDLKDEATLASSLKKNLFEGLGWQERIRLAREIYMDTTRYLACTGDAGNGECKSCQKIIEIQRKVSQDVLNNTIRD